MKIVYRMLSNLRASSVCIKKNERNLSFEKWQKCNLETEN